MPAQYSTTSPYTKRAQAAERMLERWRIGLQNAIEILEIVGYSVTLDHRGCYKVTPPGPSGVTIDEDKKELLEQPGFLDEYPPMLSTKNIAAITGMSQGRITILCKDGKLPATKIGDGRWFVPKTYFTDASLHFDAEA